MTKCPLFIAADVDPADNPYFIHACLEENCAWYVRGQEANCCAVKGLVLLANIFGAVQFPGQKK